MTDGCSYEKVRKEKTGKGAKEKEEWGVIITNTMLFSLLLAIIVRVIMKIIVIVVMYFCVVLARLCWFKSLGHLFDICKDLI